MRERSFHASMIVEMRTSFRIFGVDGALFAGVTPYHPASLVTTITLAVSVLVAYQNFTAVVRLF